MKVTEIAGRLLEFLSNAEHSRALPGHETVSVAYRCRKPKFLLKKSKLELLDIFKKENPDVTSARELFSVTGQQTLYQLPRKMSRGMFVLNIVTSGGVLMVSAKLVLLTTCQNLLEPSAPPQSLPVQPQWLLNPPLGLRSVLWDNVSPVQSSKLIFLPIPMSRFTTCSGKKEKPASLIGMATPSRSTPSFLSVLLLKRQSRCWSHFFLK